MKRAVLALLLLLAATYDGVDRYKLQRRILELEQQNEKQHITIDMLRYRAQHPLRMVR